MTLAEENALVESEFNDLLQGYINSNHRKKVEIIERAFRFARKAHKGVRRRSGEPYILHPIAVAKIVSQEIGLGSTSICAALLHDVVEDTDYTVEDIESQFGSKIARIVDGLTKISGGIFGDKASVQAENFRKLLLTMSEDIRVVLIKMADRLHNMRTLGSMAPNKQYKIAGETLYIYAPLAHRLGLFSIKTELEDLSFKYEHPSEYARIAELIKQSEERRNSIYNDFSAPIKESLAKMGLKYEAKARLKSVYSIWRKMEAKHIPFEEVYDLYAMRIIFDCENQAQEKAICWQIYSAITDLYRLHPDRTRDWISAPKANGYQALHLTVMGPDGNWIEVQIRSRRMDEIAEKGFAAHWKYKIGGNTDEENELNVWLRTIKDILDDPNPNAIDFLDTLKLNLFSSEIVVFTPKGELITLPTGATVLDVAYSLHSQLGDKCIAGKVNHKLVPLSHRLSSGDQVEVLTSQSQTPKPEWIAFLATAKAKTRLKAALRRIQHPDIERGKAILADFLKEREVEATNEILTKMMAYYHITTRDDLYVKLGRGDISLDGYILRESPKTDKSLLKKFLRIGRRKTSASATGAPDGNGTVRNTPINTKEKYILNCSDNEQNFVFPDCCRPIPGDDVMGFINDVGQVEVHSLTCPRAQVLKASYGNRILATEWGVVQQKFRAEILVRGIDRQGILSELTAMISTQLGIDIRSLNIAADDEVFECRLGVKVEDTATIDDLCAKVKKIKGVKSAVRVS
ncbi:MAG: bifunctional (p)ppGpp synthetase/guanosine-3',5'-bis(diphosphate) 3'-pyrophosphohydrolase [Bacteroides sp.]|nr:bifunctional (p)ppGpp synthetase/guanosine-3',5'-bis(diphosphate) 3'-pyrophosphohydrolase [Bacteroides sp.]